MRRSPSDILNHDKDDDTPCKIVGVRIVTRMGLWQKILDFEVGIFFVCLLSVGVTDDYVYTLLSCVHSRLKSIVQIGAVEMEWSLSWSCPIITIVDEEKVERYPDRSWEGVHSLETWQEQLKVGGGRCAKYWRIMSECEPAERNEWRGGM